MQRIRGTVQMALQKKNGMKIPPEWRAAPGRQNGGYYEQIFKDNNAGVTGSGGGRRSLRRGG